MDWHAWRRRLGYGPLAPAERAFLAALTLLSVWALVLALLLVAFGAALGSVGGARYGP